MAQKKSKKGSGAGKAVGVGVLLAATAAAAAGTYYLYGSKHAAQNRKKVKGWMLKARGEVVEKLENAKEVSQDKYDDTVDSVMKRYKKLSSVSSKEADELGKELKKHWKEIVKAAGTGAKKSSKK